MTKAQSRTISPKLEAEAERLGIIEPLPADYAPYNPPDFWQEPSNTVVAKRPRNVVHGIFASIAFWR